jgi:hypothetical protein
MENNLPKPALYDHISYKRAMHFTLSTSQVYLNIFRNNNLYSDIFRLVQNMIV